MFDPGNIHLGVNDKRQITATFIFTASGSFLPIQLTYSGKTKLSIPKYDFPNCFDVTYTLDHWSSYEIFFEKIIFPYLKAKKEELGYPKKQYSLIMMDTFKGQSNTGVKALCLKND